MSGRVNPLGQPIGDPVPGWSPRPRPPLTAMTGRWCDVVPLDPPRHGAALFEEFRTAPDEAGWTYLMASPPSLGERPTDRDAYLAALADAVAAPDSICWAICGAAAGVPLGVASYLRIDPVNGSIEVGSIHHGPRLQRTPAATEAMYLMMARAFDELGYRRYEWKCDSRNGPSRAAARRLGFTFEGIFRQAVVYKGRNRDTAWYSILDTEWASLRAAFEAWSSPDNLDDSGRQLTSLAAVRADIGHLRQD